MNNIIAQEKSLRGIGKRKTSIATVYLLPGEGKIEVNNKPYGIFFNALNDEKEKIKKSLTLLKYHRNFDIFAKVRGGGLMSQLEAIILGISKALSKISETEKKILSTNNFLKRDSRIKERRKYGLKKARKAQQYSKR